MGTSLATALGVTSLVFYGPGMVPITRMLRSGAAFDVAGVLLITAGLLLLGT